MSALCFYPNYFRVSIYCTYQLRFFFKLTLIAWLLRSQYSLTMTRLICMISSCRMVISSYIIVDYMRQSKVHLLEHSSTHPSNYSSRSFRILKLTAVIRARQLSSGQKQSIVTYCLKLSIAINDRTKRMVLISSSGPTI